MYVPTYFSNDTKNLSDDRWLRKYVVMLQEIWLVKDRIAKKK